MRASLDRLPKADRVAVEAWLAGTSGPDPALVAGVLLHDPWALVVAGIVSWPGAERLGGIDPHGDVTTLRPGSRVQAAILAALRDLALERGHFASRAGPLAALVRARLTTPPRAPGERSPHRRLTTAEQAALDGAIAAALAALAAEQLVVAYTPTRSRPTAPAPGAGAGPWIQLAEAAATEASVAARLARLAAATLPDRPHAAAQLDRLLADAVDGRTLSPEQAAPIRRALRHRLVVATGPAGTGKTVVIKAAVRAFEALRETVLVATPTAKAAEVLIDRGVAQATTAHALLGITPDDTAPLSWPADRPSPLHGDVLLLDEGTMYDTVVWERLLAAIPPTMRVLVFGDVGQLAAVGPGGVFRLLVEEGDREDALVVLERIRTVRRTGGRLTALGMDLYEGRLPTFDDPLADPTAVEAAWYDTEALPGAYRDAARDALGKKATAQDIEGEALARWLVDIAARQMPAALAHRDPSARGIAQVITPQAPGPLGTTALNGKLRDVVNPLPDGEVESRWRYADGLPARAGDHVLLLDAIDDTLRNGRTGEVVSLGREARQVVVRFAGRPDPVVLKPDQCSALILRYAVTCYKTQGSEYTATIQVQHELTASSLATRSALYTGFTRGKKASAIFGSASRLRYAIANVQGDVRQSTIADRLWELAAPE